MNNLNTQVYVGLSKKLKERSPDWMDSLRKSVKTKLETMSREFSDMEFSNALKQMEPQKITLAGITFFLYTF